jgi:hypothetical protein
MKQVCFWLIIFETRISRSDWNDGVAEGTEKVLDKSSHIEKPPGLQYLGGILSLCSDGRVGWDKSPTIALGSLG